jgi:hypothetical protein
MVVRWSGELRQRTRMISLRSRMESVKDRYSRARVWVVSERSVGSEEVARIDMIIEIELCSAPGQLGF